MKLLDVLLFPSALYQKVTDRKSTLFFGVLFVGAVDMLFTLIEKYPVLFAGKAQGVLTYNVLLAAACIIVLGVADVFFLCLPLFDLFKLFKKEEGYEAQGNMLVKLMKIYILAHFIIVPVEILIYIAARSVDGLNTGLVYFIVLLDVALPFWFGAAITRGINSIYKFQPLFRRLVFIVVLIWSYLLGKVLFFVINNWLINLFR